MDDREALLAAILDHPEEDTPRLVFADWLDEHGEGERAAFIRRQIELADVPEWDARAIRARPLDWAVSWGTQWPPPALPAPLDWEETPCRRGFPSAVCVKNGLPLVEQLPATCAIAPLCELEWWGRREEAHPGRGALPHWRTLTDSPWLSRFRSLGLPLARLSGDDLVSLAESPHATGLKALNLETCGLERNDVSVLFTTDLVRRLARLALSTGDDVLDALVRLDGHRLREFRFTAGRNHDRSPLLWDTDLLRAPLFQGLKELDLSHNLTTPADVGRLASSGALRGLESLQLKWCRTGPGAATAIAECADAGALRRLVLKQNGLGPNDAQALAEAPHLCELTVLDLEGNPIGDTGAQAIARSPHFTNLLALDLSNCAIGDVGAQAILDSALSEQLVHLALFSNALKPSMKGKFTRRMGRRAIT